MKSLAEWIRQDEYDLLSEEDRIFLEVTLRQSNYELCLTDLWRLMDKAWTSLECDSSIVDSRIKAFYTHPVWLLNGLFSERDAESRRYREVITNWVGTIRNTRIADYGGGFGSLARMIATKYPSASVEIIEPFPHPIARYRTCKIPNVSYKRELTGNYDIILATDVFEHVLDPLFEVSQTAISLKRGGIYLMANCFKPVIRCHLPQLYHFNFSWRSTMIQLGLEHVGRIAYGDAFRFNGKIDLDQARIAEVRSKHLWSTTKFLPSRIGRFISSFLIG